MSIVGSQTLAAPRFDQKAREYDALLVLSFGGPEGPSDVIPFLENVTSGRNIPRERLEEVGEHYMRFGGVSPINAQNRSLVAALEREFAENNLNLPVYFGNRNWHPFLADTVRDMVDDGVERALVFVTSAFSSYSGCRQYREDILRATNEIGNPAPAFDKIRTFYNHPGYIEPMIELTLERWNQIPPAERSTTRLLFTAHSIPSSMAANCAYERQLREASRLIAEGVHESSFELAFQSRSGPPQVPWLEPDILDSLSNLREQGTTQAVVVSVGFISDHMEIIFDLDTEAAEHATGIGIGFHRVPTVGTHPRFVEMIRELTIERMTENPDRPALGKHGPSHDICPMNCCLRGAAGRPSTRGATASAPVS